MVRSGQVLVVVLFVLAIGITVAMAISSRSVTEIAVSTTQDESSRALEAAQIGLERYLGGLQTGGTGGELVDMNASFTVPSVDTVSGQSYYMLPYAVKTGEVATIDLPSTLNRGVKLCWCQEDDEACPSDLYPKIEAAFYFRDPPGTQRIKRRAIKPAEDTSPADYLSFLGGSSRDKCGTSTWFRYSATTYFNENDTGLNVFISNGDNKDFVRVRMLDACDDIGNCYYIKLAAQSLTNNQNFPPQWSAVESIGTSGDTVQKIKATVMVYDLPAIFDTAVFAGTQISKN